MNTNLRLVSLCTSLILLLGGQVAAKAATSISSIHYGVVEQVQSIDKETKHASGALVGGLMGALIGPKRHRGAKMVAGAAIGAGVQGAATSGQTAQQYTVKLMYGGEIKISTEQTDIRTGDCVTIEQGEYANIRRCASVHCESPGKTTPPEHHVSASSNCQLSKNELANAVTDEEVNIAVKKVKILCED